MVAVRAHKFLMIALIAKAVLCAVVSGVIFFGWFLATVNSPPKRRPAHSAPVDFAVYLTAGTASSVLSDACLWHRGLGLSLAEHALPIANLALLFMVMNQIRRIRHGALELTA